jgi:hypothetical protein
MEAYIEQRLRSISINCMLTGQERDKLVQMYLNTDANQRDQMIEDIEKMSRIRDVGIRRLIKEKIIRS